MSQIRTVPNRERDNHEASNYKFMYEFRCTACSKVPGKCTMTKETCFYSHNTQTHRRVPMIQSNGLYNYIPEECQSWKQHQKCSRGDECRRAHGWLEVIFHPLLYKTKLCDHRKGPDGLCTGYAIHCAKAHNTGEIRNLKKIFGLEWKRHYDLTRTSFDDPADLNKPKLAPSSSYPRVQGQQRVFANDINRANASDRFRRPASEKDDKESEGSNNASRDFKSNRSTWILKRKAMADSQDGQVNWRQRASESEGRLANLQRHRSAPILDTSESERPMIQRSKSMRPKNCLAAEALQEEHIKFNEDTKSQSSGSDFLSPKFAPRVLSDDDSPTGTSAKSCSGTSSSNLPPQQCMKLRQVVAMGLKKKNSSKHLGSDSSLSPPRKREFINDPLCNEGTPTKKIRYNSRMPTEDVVTPRTQKTNQRVHEPLHCPVSPFGFSPSFNKHDEKFANPVGRAAKKKSSVAGTKIMAENLFTEQLLAHLMKGAKSGCPDAAALLHTMKGMSTQQQETIVRETTRGKNMTPEQILQRLTPKKAELLASPQLLDFNSRPQLIKQYQTPDGYYQTNLPPAAYNLLTPEKVDDLVEGSGLVDLKNLNGAVVGGGVGSKQQNAAAAVAVANNGKANGAGGDGAAQMDPRELFGHGTPQQNSWESPMDASEMMEGGGENSRPAGAPLDETYADDMLKATKKNFSLPSFSVKERPKLMTTTYY